MTKNKEAELLQREVILRVVLVISKLKGKIFDSLSNDSHLWINIDISSR